MEKFIERLFMSLGRVVICILRFPITALRCLFRKRVPFILAAALGTLLVVGIIFDPTGFFATWKAQMNHFLSQLSFGSSGLVISILILWVLLGVEPIRKIVFRYVDELDDMADQWRENKGFTTGEGLLAVAFALATAGIALAIFILISNMGTPLG